MAIPGLPSNRSKCRPMVGNKLEKDIIIKIVCEHFDTTIDQLKSPSRKRPLVYKRQIIMYLLGHYTNETYLEIGKLFDRDHTTVIHSKDLIKDLIGVDDKVKDDIDEIKAKIIDAHY